VSTSLGVDTVASDIAIQADGRIVVVGSVCRFDSICDFAIVRFETNGSLDASFDGDGKVVVDMGNSDFAADVVIQPDGRIVVVGASGVSQNRNYDFAIARL